MSARSKRSIHSVAKSTVQLPNRDKLNHAHVRTNLDLADGFTDHHGAGCPALCDLRRRPWGRSTAAPHPTYVPRVEDGVSKRMQRRKSLLSPGWLGAYSGRQLTNALSVQEVGSPWMGV